MGRAPCCEKLGLKKGPWSEEEDQVLVSFIQNNGHGNWRSLPKRAGLLRCGKSCRLRWTNYLRPDIKRGNFTREEEETIIRLHQEMGNRWSAIAAELPGRTDNEIKNVWHTHLKKRLSSNSADSSPESSNGSPSIIVTVDAEPLLSREHSFSTDLSSQPSTECSFLMDQTTSDFLMPDLEESIWSEEFTVPWFQGTPDLQEEDDDMDFWMRMLIEAGDIQHL